MAVSSRTTALHLALLSIDISSKDEVIISALTFVADINVVKIVAAKPVLADCESYENWNVSLDSIKKVVTDKMKAIIVVHYVGYPVNDIEEIVKFCKENNIYLIEDCAHALGARVNNKAIGIFGVLVVLFFYK